MANSFEKDMERLEIIVKELEMGSNSLDNSIALFDEGVKLTAKLQSMLNKAEQKIKVLVKDNGEIVDKDVTEEI